jgi:ligand-binding sensor domain-containing protein
MTKNILLLGLITLLLASCKKHSNEIIPTIIPENRALSDVILKDYFITSIAFDKKGNAWLGTLAQGLIRYDGKTVKIFDSSNSTVTNTAIMDIAVDKADHVWIGSDDLLRYDGTRFTRYESSRFGFPKNTVRSIEIDASGSIWFSCGSFQSGGLVKYDGNTFKTFTKANSELPGNLVQSIAIDRSNHVWAAINDGVANVSLARITPGNSISVVSSKELGFTPYYFGNIVVNKNNELLGSINYGLSSTIVPGRPQIFSFNGSKTHILSLPDEKLVVYGTQCIFSDKNGNLWASFYSANNEYGIFDGRNWKFPEIGTGGIFVFAENPNGEMWMGTGQGVYILK